MHTRTTFVALATITSLAMLSCEKAPPPTSSTSPTTTEPEQSEVENSEPEAPKAPTASAANPAPATVAPTATPPADHLTPEGVFYITRAVSVETADGIVGLKPGTQAVRQADGRFLADGHSVELQPSQITNDLRVARQAAAIDQSTQQKLRQALATSPKAPQAAPAMPEPPAYQAPQTYQPPPPAQEFVEGVNRQSTGLQSSTSLGAQHTRTGEGFLWQKSPDGKWWVPIKRLDGKTMSYVPPRKRT